MGHVPLPLTTNKAKEIEHRFWPKVKRGEPEECWLWIAKARLREYGSFMAWKRPQYAHRIAYALVRGDLRLGDYVLHECDTPLCCNPDHLFLGTHTDNMRDKVAKGRGNFARGSASGGAKIDEATALAIFNDPGAVMDTARKYGVTHTTVYNIRSGQTWCHVTGAKGRIRVRRAA